MNTLARSTIVTAFVAFFALGACIAFVAAVALLTPGGFLEPIWRLNPRAQIAFASLGGWSIVLMSGVSALCLSAAVGLWRRKRWGYYLAIAILIINLIGDTTNVLLGTERRAVIGIPVALILLWLLSRRSMHTYFGIPCDR